MGDAWKWWGPKGALSEPLVGGRDDMEGIAGRAGLESWDEGVGWVKRTLLRSGL